MKPESVSAIYADDLPSRAVLVWLYLAKRANRDGQCWPSYQRIATDLSLSYRTVQRAVADLERAGWLKRENRHRDDGTNSSILFTLRKLE